MLSGLPAMALPPSEPQIDKAGNYCYDNKMDGGNKCYRNVLIYKHSRFAVISHEKLRL